MEGPISVESGYVWLRWQSELSSSRRVTDTPAVYEHANLENTRITLQIFVSSALSLSSERIISFPDIISHVVTLLLAI
jgi:hypothetical protein